MSTVEILLHSMTVPVSDELETQLAGEKALNKASKDLFGRLLGPSGGTGGLLYGKINGLKGSLTKPLSPLQSQRVKTAALEVLTTASETYNGWLSANEQIATTVSTIPLSGTDVSAAETHLVNIVNSQQQISLGITSRYDEFVSKVNALLQLVDLSVEMVRAKDERTKWRGNGTFGKVVSFH